MTLYKCFDSRFFMQHLISGDSVTARMPVTHHFAQAKVTIRKQMTLPKKVQDKLGSLKEGEYILFYEDQGRIYIKKGVLVPEV